MAETAAAAKIDPTTPNTNLHLRTGLGGGTSLSMQRRAHDHRFGRDISSATA